MNSWDRSPSRAPGLDRGSAEDEEPEAEQQLSERRRSVAMQRRWVQRKANGQNAAGGRVPDSLGHALNTDVRRGMERHLGADVSHARIHTGADSAAAAEQFGARAFTVGTDVHFGAGEFAPGSPEGDRLLAHELTHVVQGQRSGVQRKPKPEGEGGDEKGESGEAGGDKEAVSKPEDPAEKEADAAGDHVAEQMHGKGKGKGKGGKEKDKEKEKGEGKEEGKEGEEEEGKEGEAEAKGGDAGGKGEAGEGGGDAKEAAPPIAAKLKDGSPQVFLSPKPNKATPPPGGKPAPGKPTPGGATPAGGSPQEAELQHQLDALAEMEKNPAAAKPEQLGKAKERIAEITMQPALQKNPKADLAKTRVQAVQDKVDAYYVERIQELIIAPLAAAKSEAQLGKVQSLIATMQRQNLDPLVLTKAAAALADGQKQLVTARQRIAAEQQKAKAPAAGAASAATPAAGAHAGKPAAAAAPPPAAAKTVSLAVDEGHKPEQPPHEQPAKEPAAHDQPDAKGAEEKGGEGHAEHAEAMKKYQKFVEYIKGVGVVDPSMPRIVKLMLETDLGPFKALIPAEYAQAEQLVHQRIAEFVQHRNATAGELLQKIEALSADEAGTDMNTELKHYRQEVDKLLECDTEGRDKLKNQLDEALNKKEAEHREAEEKKKESGGDAEGAAPAKPEKGRVGKFLDDRKEKKQEKKQAKVIAKGEVDGDIALNLLKECFGASKKAMEKGEVKLVSTDALRSVVGEADYDRITENGKKTVFGLNQDGVNYINSEALVGEHKDKGLTVLVHEMLHQNTAAGFKEGCGTLGLNEGVTEWLTRQVVEQKQLVPHNLYEGQLMVVQELLNSGLSASFLKDCYFNSGKAVLSGWIAKHCQGSFEKIDQALVDGNSAKAIAYAGRK